ncbi:uncharacterized protein [Watersipora subatra]|uniref:uncharacterized protein n=1 Tax=Watersipora subatra TaxID=2589382 RepID=UPI00355B1398
MYFIDARSCLRKINRVNGEVKTVLGNCLNGSFGIPDADGMSVHGMAYIESRQLFAVSITNFGIHLCYRENITEEIYTCRQLIDSQNIEGGGWMMSRGFDTTGEPNNYIWQKVGHGINRYDMTEVFQH